LRCPPDPHLRTIIEAWPHLPQPVRRALLALVGSVVDAESP
jgi:hypothetical protein